MDDITQDAKPTGNFWGWLREHKQGALHSELSEALAEVTNAVLEHGKVGSLTLKISVAPTKDGITVFVSDDLTVKAPQADRGGSIMFADHDGNLTRRDPRQLEMPMRVVELENGDPIVVDATTGEVRDIRG
jgi:hypothetical protein